MRKSPLLVGGPHPEVRRPCRHFNVVGGLPEGLSAVQIRNAMCPKHSLHAELGSKDRVESQSVAGLVLLIPDNSHFVRRMAEVEEQPPWFLVSRETGSCTFKV